MTKARLTFYAWWCVCPACGRLGLDVWTLGARGPQVLECPSCGAVAEGRALA